MERHAPANAADLVVHKKKVAEVRAWLQGAVAAHAPAQRLSPLASVRRGQHLAEADSTPVCWAMRM